MAEQEFKYFIDINEIIISVDHESSYKNKLKMWIDFEGKSECELDEIRYKFPAGLGADDFAQKSDIKKISCSITEGWTLETVSLQELELLREGKAKKQPYDHICYLYISQDEDNYIYTFFAPAGWGFEENPIFTLNLSNVVTTAQKGQTQVSCELYYDGEFLDSYIYEILKKQEETVKIRDFYPDKGAASDGETIQLNWKVENAEELILEVDGEEITQDRASSGCSVKPTNSTRYRLKAKNGEASDERETMIQVLPVFLQKFQINEEDQTVEWNVPCAAEVTVTASDALPAEMSGEKVSSENSRSLKDFPCPGKIILTAKGVDTDIESVLYYGTPDERTDIAHFRKTITYYKHEGFQILNVEWKRYQLAFKNTAKSIRIVYQDRERNELYVIKGKDALEEEGSWEQILTGTDPDRAGQNILVTMNVHVYQGAGSQDYDITI